MHPLSLREIQKEFWNSIARRPGECVVDALFLTNIADGSRLGSFARVSVYSNAYFLRLREVLAQDFPETGRALGEDRFDRIAREYLRQFPSENPSVRNLGRSMADFLDGRSDVPPYLGDLARLEWLLSAAFDSADSAAIGVSDLRAIEPQRWPHLRFRPTPALALMRAKWPVHELWSGASSGTIRPVFTWICVWRDRDCRVFHAAIDCREAEAMTRMIGGEPFAAICGAYADLGDDEAARLSVATFVSWLDRGLISAAE